MYFTKLGAGLSQIRNTLALDIKTLAANSEGAEAVVSEAQAYLVFVLHRNCACFLQIEGIKITTHLMARLALFLWLELNPQDP